MHHRVDIMANTGLYEDGKKGIRRPSDPVLRAKDMDRDGVQAEVLYGILGAATRLDDHEAATEMFRIYNDWLADFIRHDPDRYIGLACLPYGDIDAAVKEIKRVAGSGCAASSCPAPGTWSPCGIPSGSRCGRPSTRWGCPCTSTPSPPSRPTCSRSRRA